MARSTKNPSLHRFAVFTALCTLCLIGIGGLVTSKGAGMAVPDWPTTYGYNMFFFPFRLWDGGIFYEHSHRLVASFVGLLTTILAVWVWVADSRRWMRVLGVVAFVLVSVQGLLGGLRVTLFKDELGIFHATLAQVFLILICAMAMFTSKTWFKIQSNSSQQNPLAARRLIVAATALILLQLILGATMRHQHAGLAVPDFPKAYGEWYPPTDDAFLLKVNQRRVEEVHAKDVTAFQIHLHMAHRIMAGVVFLSVLAAVWKIRQTWSRGSPFRKWAHLWLGLILVQASLGAWTVWSNKAADIATLHVVVGAACFMAASMLGLIAFRGSGPSAVTVAKNATEPDLAVPGMVSQCK